MQITGRVMTSRAASLWILALLAAAGAACGPRDFAETPALPTVGSDIDAVVYLIGDAGAATPESEVIIQLRREVVARSSDSEVVVAFLGDNIYERGLHPPDHPSHAQDAAYLEAQIDVVRDVDALGVFVPGNHDWGYGGEQGVQQVRRQGDYIANVAAQGVPVTMLPPAGCPGPQAMSVGETALIIFMESDLWLRDHDWAESQSCDHTSPEASLDALRQILEANARVTNRHVVVLAHHPLKTYGSHGGYYGLKDQFFPLTNVWGPLYLPVPFIYPIARNSGVSSQDMSHGRYQSMVEQFSAVFLQFAGNPLVHAAGHDHNLQVFDGAALGSNYVLVSGAGSRLTSVGWDDALFAAGEQHREKGYMRLEFFTDGRVLLSVLTDGTVSCDKAEGCSGEPQVRYWRWLTDR